MKFTFVVPVYNSEDTIEECLKALLSQKGAEYQKDYEILVVNDGSTDDTTQILETFKEKYSIQIVNLEENKGRVEARKTGALNSRTEKLAFIDSRVIASEDLAFQILKLNYTPAIAGNFDLRKDKYKSIYDTVFFLIRRRYYGSKFLSEEQDKFYINKVNFLKSPKGTTLLVIDKELFLDILPTKVSKTTSDDTLLFHNLVFKKNISVLRSTKLKVNYLQRRELKKLIPWLFHRGKLFSDYYLVRGGAYRKYMFAAIVLIILAIALSIFYPQLILKMILAVYLIFCIYLSENIRDFFVVAFSMPFITIIFICGVVKYFYDKFTELLR